MEGKLPFQAVCYHMLHAHVEMVDSYRQCPMVLDSWGYHASVPVAGTLGTFAGGPVNGRSQLQGVANCLCHSLPQLQPKLQ